MKFLKKFALGIFCAVAVFSVINLNSYAKADIDKMIVKDVNVVSKVSLPNNDYLFEKYVEKTLYPQMSNVIAPSSTEAYNTLSADEKPIYTYLKTEIKKIADGETSSATIALDSVALEALNSKTSWSVAELGVTSNEPNDIYTAAVNKFFENISISDIIDALLVDCPYDLYWYDKAGGGLNYSVPCSFSGAGSVYTNVSITGLKFVFSVAVEYQPTGYSSSTPTTDISKTSAASTACKNANAIVEKYKNAADYQKLKAYRDVICDLVSYNSDAASNSEIPYGNPWQIVWVFDNDTTTNVVCEGYSKAFQYLFDLSEFEGSIKCYTVTGTMNGGGHMWNVVKMDDRKSYMVDITNSDTGSIGQGGGLFLSGMSGSISAGYNFTLNAYNSVTYVFDAETKSLWGVNSDSILNLSNTDYNYDKNVEALGNYSTSLNISKEYKGIKNTKITITPKTGYELPKVKLIRAVVGSQGNIVNAEITNYTNSSKIEFTPTEPTLNSGESCKFFVWSENGEPLIKPIKDLKSF